MKDFDAIIVGGSSAGLSAGMALGRAMRKVLIIDSGDPCNRPTPHSHNFFTRDGQTPHEILTIGREQTLKYPTISLIHGEATQCVPITNGFEINTKSGETFSAKKVILAAGIKDQIPDIPGFAECWGISIIHCPYCHGYEYGHQRTGVFANGETAFELTKLISNWAEDLILFTNGKSTLTIEQQTIIRNNNIQIIEQEIEAFDHHNGQIKTVRLRDDSEVKLQALYARLPFVQHSDIALQLGCQFTDQGHIQVDARQKTTIPGVYACGDSASGIRSIANAVNSGMLAGVTTNLDLTDEVFLARK